MNIIFELKLREVKGKDCKSLRKKENAIPAVIFGKGIDSINVQLDNSQLKLLLEERKSATPLNVKVGDKSYKVIIRSVECDPVTDKISHIDFLNVTDDRIVKVAIPVKVNGISPAVKNGWGVLMKALDYVWVKCLPKDIPPSFEIDVSKLEKLGDNIMVSDLPFPAGVTVINSKELARTVVTVASFQKRVEEEGASTEGAATELGEEAESGSEEAVKDASK